MSELAPRAQSVSQSTDNLEHFPNTVGEGHLHKRVRGSKLGAEIPSFTIVFIFQ